MEYHCLVTTTYFVSIQTLIYTFSQLPNIELPTWTSDMQSNTIISWTTARCPNLTFKFIVACVSASKICSLIENPYSTSYPAWSANLCSEHEKQPEKGNKALLGPEKGQLYHQRLTVERICLERSERFYRRWNKTYPTHEEPESPLRQKRVLNVSRKIAT